MDKFYAISKNAMLNEVETQGVVFCQNEAGEKIYYLNDTSLSVVLFLQSGKRRFTEIVSEILRLFEVSQEECESDMESLLKDLETYKIIEVVSEQDIYYCGFIENVTRVTKQKIKSEVI